MGTRQDRRQHDLVAGGWSSSAVFEAWTAGAQRQELDGRSLDGGALRQWAMDPRRTTGGAGKKGCGVGDAPAVGTDLPLTTLHAAQIPSSSCSPPAGIPPAPFAAGRDQVGSQSPPDAVAARRRLHRPSTTESRTLTAQGTLAVSRRPLTSSPRPRPIPTARRRVD